MSKFSFATGIVATPFNLILPQPVLVEEKKEAETETSFSPVLGEIEKAERMALLKRHFKVYDHIREISYKEVLLYLDDPDLWVDQGGPLSMIYGSKGEPVFRFAYDQNHIVLYVFFPENQEQQKVLEKLKGENNPFKVMSKSFRQGNLEKAEVAFQLFNKKANGKAKIKLLSFDGFRTLMEDIPYFVDGVYNFLDYKGQRMSVFELALDGKATKAQPSPIIIGEIQSDNTWVYHVFPFHQAHFRGAQGLREALRSSLVERKKERGDTLSQEEAAWDKKQELYKNKKVLV